MLEPYLQKNIKQMDGLVFIHCPEIVDLYCECPQMDELLNTRYHVIKKERELALSNKDYMKYIFLTTKPYRLDAFLYILNNTKCSYEDLADILLKVWMHIECPSINKNIWANLFRYFKDSNVFQKTKLKLPQKITVWRGGTSDGLSWTTDKKVAVKFANRFHDYKPEIHCRQVHKSDVICCLEDRSESEIILLNR